MSGIANAEMTAEPAPHVLAESNTQEISPAEETALLQEASNLAERLNDAALAAFAAAEKISDPQQRGDLEANASRLKGLASSARGMSPAQVRGGGLGGMAASAMVAIGAAKAAGNDARYEAAMDASEAARSAALRYDATRFSADSHASQRDMRDSLRRSGRWTSSTDTYFNSTTEAQYRTYEEDLQNRIDAASGAEKESLLREQQEMTKIKWKQLNDEAMKAQEKFERDNPALAQEMQDLYGNGALQKAARHDVGDPELRESLAIIDANKFMEMEKRIREKQENNTALTGEEKRALEFLDSDEYKNLTPDQKDHIKQAAKKIQENKAAESEKNKDKLPALQAEMKQIREKAEQEGWPQDQLEKELTAAREGYSNKIDYKAPQPQQEKPPTPESPPTQNTAAAGQVVQIAPDSQSVGAPVRSPAEQDFMNKYGFVPDKGKMTEIAMLGSILSVCGVCGGSQQNGDPPHQHVSNPDHVQQKHMATDESRTA